MRDWSPGLFISGTIVVVLLGYQNRFLAVALSVIAAGMTVIGNDAESGSGHNSGGSSGRQL